MTMRYDKNDRIYLTVNEGRPGDLMILNPFSNGEFCVPVTEAEFKMISKANLKALGQK